MLKMTNTIRNKSITFERLVDGGIYSAGILPVYHRQVLLGKEKRGWSGFSGKREATDVTTESTAIREFQEETIGLLELDDVIRLLKTARLIQSSTPRGFKFYLFVAHVQESDYNKLTNERFQRKRISSASVYEREKTEIKWVDVDKIEDEELSHCFKNDLSNIQNILLNTALE